MYPEAKKIRLIERLLKEKSEAVLSEVESILKRNASKRKGTQTTRRKPSDYAGCISEGEARELLHQVEQSRNEWERNI